MSFRANKYLVVGAVLLLWGSFLSIRPLPPICHLPDGGNGTARYTGEDVYRPVRQALYASATLHLFPVCFGAVRTTDGFGWTYTTAETVQKQAYEIFARQAELHPKILRGLGYAFLLWHVLLLFHQRYRRKKNV